MSVDSFVFVSQAIHDSRSLGVYQANSARCFARFSYGTRFQRRVHGATSKINFVRVFWTQLLDSAEFTVISAFPRFPTKASGDNFAVLHDHRADKWMRFLVFGNASLCQLHRHLAELPILVFAWNGCRASFRQENIHEPETLSHKRIPLLPKMSAGHGSSEHRVLLGVLRGESA